MEFQHLTKRHQRLHAFLLNIVKLNPEDFRFGDTEGEAKAVVDEAQRYQFAFVSDEPFGSEVPVIYPVTDEPDDNPLQDESGKWLQQEHSETHFAEYAPHDDTVKRIKMHHEYVIHLIVQHVEQNLTRLLAQLQYWLASERQEPQIDYTLKWNNSQTVDLHIYLDIEERTTGNTGDELKTC